MDQKNIASSLKLLADDVKKAESAEEARDKILGAANRILEFVHEEKYAFDRLEQNRKKVTFRIFGNIGSKVCDFYKEYGNSLDESSTGLKNQLDKVTLCVSEIQQKERDIHEQIEELKTGEDLILGKEKELCSLEKERLELTTKIEYLKTLEQQNTPEILEYLRTEADKIKNDVGEKFENDKSNLKMVLDDLLKTAGPNFDEQYQTLTAEIVEVIARHRDKCKSLEEQKRKVVSDMGAEIEKTRDYFENFPQLVSAIKQDFDYFKVFNKENSHIYEKMKNYGLHGPDDLKTKAEELKLKSDEITREYNEILSNFLDAAEIFKTEIERRQKRKTS